MSFLNLVTGLVGLFKTLTGLFRDRQLIKSGEDRYASKQGTQRLDIIRKAQAARRALTSDDADGLPDRHDRDRDR